MGLWGDPQTPRGPPREHFKEKMKLPGLVLKIKPPPKAFSGGSGSGVSPRSAASPKESFAVGLRESLGRMRGPGKKKGTHLEKALGGLSL